MYPRADVYFTCERQPLSYPRLAGENSADLTLVVSARVKVTGTTGLRRGEPALARGTALHSNREWGSSRRDRERKRELFNQRQLAGAA